MGTEPNLPHVCFFSPGISAEHPFVNNTPLVTEEQRIHYRGASDALGQILGKIYSSLRSPVHRFRQPAEVLVSYLGMLYFRGFFDDTVLEARHPGGPCYNQDDMWFSAHVAAKGIPRRPPLPAFRMRFFSNCFSIRPEQYILYISSCFSGSHSSDAREKKERRTEYSSQLPL